MWMNGLSIMGGAVLATSALIVANENLGGELLAYIVAALGAFSLTHSLFHSAPSPTVTTSPPLTLTLTLTRTHAHAH